MSQNRISLAKSPCNSTMPHMYCAPRCARILRVFDTAPLDGSLIEVLYVRYSDDLIRLASAPAGDVWVEHVDTTINPKPAAASNLGDLEFAGHVAPGQLSAGTLAPGSIFYTQDHGLTQVNDLGRPRYISREDAGQKQAPDARLDKIISLLKRLVREAENADIWRSIRDQS